MFNPLDSSTNQELFESISVIKVAIMKNMDDFHYAKEAIMRNHQINAFHSKDEWNTKEDTIGQTAVCQKAPLGLK